MTISSLIFEEKLPLDEQKGPLFVSLVEILTRVARRKRAVGIATGVAALIGITYAFLAPVKFTATTKLLTPTQTPSTALMVMNQLSNSGAGSLLAAGSSGFGLRNPNDIYIGLLRSRPVEDGIINRFKLVSAFRTKDMTGARTKLEEDTSVTSDKSQLISVSFTDKDKTRAADIANAYTEQLRILTQSIAISEASQRLLFYDAQLKDAKEKLDSAELSFQQIQQKKGLVHPDVQARALVASLTELRAQVVAKEVELQSVRSYSTERNPEAQLLENQLASLRGEANRLEERNSAGPTDNNLTKMAGAGLEYLRAEREFLYRQALLDLLTKQYDAAQLDEAKEGAVIQVVESAIPPERKSSPHRLAIIVAFSLLGLLGACTYIFTDELVRKDLAISQALREFWVAMTSA
ncbi:Wzz/FepE/Etk N-terminal domain-containing protein [Telmatobacter sp. DSM 110680]|uniref:Wzz/FepE/Etk N-terminal domain-containing protein n=1 Tax=Telmatobacter sp. DSM 110680 TaxID=3036704 RepID=A0AAU7DJB4_9BACT